MSALQATQNPGNKSGQQIIYTIVRATMNTKTHGIVIRLQWMPGHCEAPGNNAANQLAKEVAIPGKTHPFSPLLSACHARGPTSDEVSMLNGRENGGI